MCDENWESPPTSAVIRSFSIELYAEYFNGEWFSPNWNPKSWNWKLDTCSFVVYCMKNLESKLAQDLCSVLSVKIALCFTALRQFPHQILRLTLGVRLSRSFVTDSKAALVVGRISSRPPAQSLEHVKNSFVFWRCVHGGHWALGGSLKKWIGMCLPDYYSMCFSEWENTF